MATTQNEVVSTNAYTLMDAKTFTYAIYGMVNSCLKMVLSTNVDESNPMHCWQSVEQDGKRYLYNIGARKFAVPSTDGSNFTLSDTPGSIAMTDGKDGVIINGHAGTQWALVLNERMSTDANLEGIVTQVNKIQNSTAAMCNVYDVNGRRQSNLQRGINILRKTDGTVKKVLMK